MASGLYDKGRQGFLGGDIDWDTNTMQHILIRESGGGGGPYYAENLATDDFFNDVPNNADCRPVTERTLGSKTITDGVADAADDTFSTVAAGDAIQDIVIFQDDGGGDAASELICHIDSAAATGLPVTPNGGDITVQWDSGANRIFKL